MVYQRSVALRVATLVIAPLRFAPRRSAPQHSAALRYASLLNARTPTMTRSVTATIPAMGLKLAIAEAGRRLVIKIPG
jgi:hypothetical protein